MKIACIHLSDIHLKAFRTPILSRTQQLATAVCAIDSLIDSVVILLSGDIANTGHIKEYEMADTFIADVISAFKRQLTKVTIDIVAIPGNHDCVLSDDQVAVRNALIAGLEGTLHTTTPDSGLVNQLLTVQQPFWEWLVRTENISMPSDSEKLCRVRSLTFLDKQTVNFLLVNTAITSRRHEEQGQLDIPTELIFSALPPPQEGAINISAFHHSYEWMPSNTAINFRGIIDQFSDFALTGHQHFSHGYAKRSEAGDQLMYLEAPALQDIDYPNASGFRMLLLEPETRRHRVVEFKWKSDHYYSIHDSAWQPSHLSRMSRPRFRIKPTFIVSLNNPGFSYETPTGGLLKLEDIFVPPDLTVATDSDKSITIGSDNALKYLIEAGHAICSGPSRCGKTSLASMFFMAAPVLSGAVPILLDGKSLSAFDLEGIKAVIQNALLEQYDDIDPESYWQLDRAKRLLIIDDWHLTGMAKEQRTEALSILKLLAGSVVIFCDDIFRFEDSADGIHRQKLLPEFRDITLKEFGHLCRGKLVDKWLLIERRGQPASTKERQREIEETDRLLLNVLGKRTLPSLPFIILCILQARDNNGPTPPEAGSFGYLYEVLVTTSLNRSVSKVTQLDKKYTILSLLAFELFKNGNDSVSRDNLTQLIGKYSEDYKVRVSEAELVNDLLDAQVLVEREKNLAFTYKHFYYYFVARYFREFINKDENVASLRQKVDYMIDNLGNREFSAIIMFLVYFTKDTRVMSRLIDRADRIFATNPICRLEEDVTFLGEMITEGREIKLPESVDIETEREKRRKARDEADRIESQSANEDASHPYSDELSIADKLRLGIQHLEILGQIVRNFPGSLPGDQKVLIIDSAYRLGMRILTALMDVIKEALLHSRTRLRQQQETVLPSEKLGVKEKSDEFDEALKALGEVSSFALVKKVSNSIGLADLEDAYTEAFDLVGNSLATRLVNLSIRLDHVSGFPEDVVTRIKRDCEKNAAAFRTLQFLVIEHIYIFGLDYKIKQRVSHLLSFKAERAIFNSSSKTS